MLKKLSKNKFFKIIFVNLIYLSLSLIKKTSNWSGVNEEVIEKKLQDNKSILIEKIAQLVRDKKIEGIRDLRDIGFVTQMVWMINMSI